MADSKPTIPLFLIYYNGSGNRCYFWSESTRHVRAFIDQHRDEWQSYELYALDLVEAGESTGLG